MYVYVHPYVCMRLCFSLTYLPSKIVCCFVCYRCIIKSPKIIRRCFLYNEQTDRQTGSQGRDWQINRGDGGGGVDSQFGMRPLMLGVCSWALLQPAIVTFANKDGVGGGSCCGERI